MIKKVLNYLESHLSRPRLKLFKTLYFNLRVLPFYQAIKFPIYIYGNIKFPMLQGSVIINSEIRRGMIKIGPAIDPFCIHTSSGFISIFPQGILEFNGPAIIGADSVVQILNDGKIILGKCVKCCSSVKIICNDSYIHIGDFSIITFNSIVMNSNFHHIIDVVHNTVSRATMPIEIGEKCWIANNCTIAAGTKLKSGTTIASGSYVNKDFSQIIEEFPLIAGRPAKLIDVNKTRFYSLKIEYEVISKFKNTEDNTIYFNYKEDMIDYEDNF